MFRKSLPLVLSGVCLFGASLSADAATVITSILGTPTETSTTNQFDANNAATKLWDGTAPVLSDIGTNRGANDGLQWAVTNSSAGPQYVVYDMGSPVAFTSFLYSQNSFGGSNPNWNWASVDVWASDTNPVTAGAGTGAATLGSDGTRLGHLTLTPIALTVATEGQKLTQYDVTGDGSAVVAQYVTFKFAPVGGSANPGGQDLWLAVPEPSVALLGGFGMLGLLRRRRS